MRGRGPVLLFPGRPDCIEFRQKVLAARAAEETWGISPDIR